MLIFRPAKRKNTADDDEDAGETSEDSSNSIISKVCSLLSLYHFIIIINIIVDFFDKNINITVNQYVHWAG